MRAFLFFFLVLVTLLAALILPGYGKKWAIPLDATADTLSACGGIVGIVGIAAIAFLFWAMLRSRQ